ncbi:hypothetical protein MD588_25225 [Photobacterium sp. SDRW27]|uniref:hypothetical protein n=1 Tax=Photobacterium obscurum TaxID=2829490 RepID=UPI0022431DE9|nr:hypothetical protein [Photobacterium obscurum]MCW8332099.1 hypothetical protein [Photobacterium obscurum]
MRKFFIFDSIVNKDFCPLFTDEEAALDASRNVSGICPVPSTVSNDKSESVTLFFYVDESGRGIGTRSHADFSRSHITSYRSLEHYQLGILE